MLFTQAEFEEITGNVDLGEDYALYVGIVEAIIEEQTGLTLGSVVVNDERPLVVGAYLFPEFIPIVSVSSVKVNGEELSADNYLVRDELVDLLVVYPPSADIRISYEAGFNYDVPDAIKGVAREMLKRIVADVDAPQYANIKQVSSEGITYVYGDEFLTDAERRVLRRFKKQYRRL